MSSSGIQPSTLNKRWIVILAALFILGFLLLCYHYIANSIDDTYITFRFSRNLAHGYGPVYNPGERVEGYSNPLFMALIAIGMLFGIDRYPLGPLWMAKLIGLGGGIWAAFMLRSVIKSSIPGIALLNHDLVWLVSAFLLFLAPAYAFWIIGGLETGLAVLLATGAIMLFLKSVDGKTNPAWASLVAALAALTRPEGALVWLPMLLISLYLWRRRSVDWRFVAGLVLPFILIYGAFLGFRLIYYGQIVPNTYFAKSGSTIVDRFSYGNWYIRRWLFYGPGGFAAIIAAIIGLSASWLKPHARWLLGLVTILYAFFAFWVGGDWMYGSRFLLPVFPAMAVLTTIGMLDILKRISGQLHLLIPMALVAFLSFVLTYHYYFGPVYLFPSGFKKFPPQLVTSRYRDIGNWCRENLPEGSLVGIGEIGVIPYFGEFRVLDLFGLIDTHTAKLPGGWNQKIDLDYLHERNPDYYILPEVKIGSGDNAKFVYKYVEVIENDQQFIENYEVVRNWDDIHLYRRRDTPP